MAATEVKADQGGQHGGSLIDKRDIHHPTDTDDGGDKPLTKVVTSPLPGSTRETLPAAPLVTYRAPSGPMVLPES